MRGAKPTLNNVIPMAGAQVKDPPPMPHYLTLEASQVWERLAAPMAAKGRLEPHFVDMFAAYCEAVANFIVATGKVEECGITYTVKTRNGLQQKKTAVYGVQTEAIATMSRLGALFGMTPVDERRLSDPSQGSFMDMLVSAVRDGGH